MWFSKSTVGSTDRKKFGIFSIILPLEIVVTRTGQRRERNCISSNLSANSSIVSVPRKDQLYSWGEITENIIDIFLRLLKF